MMTIKDSLNTYRFDFEPFFNRKRKKNGHFFTLRGESDDLEELFSSLFVYLLLIVLYVPTAMLFAYSIFRNLAVMFWVPLLLRGATAFCNDGGWF